MTIYHHRPGVNVANDFSIDHLLIHEATIHRYTRTRLPGGTFKETWAPVKDMKCRFTVYTPKNTVTVTEQKEYFPASYKVFTLGDENIVEGDRVVFKGSTYEVVGPPLNPSFLDHHLEVEVKLVPREV
jgi:hypothetical protein